jgi:N-acetylneuraminate synthase/pseudaminic acid synthase
MSGNHQGSLESALDFVRRTKAVGADLLKVQVYRPDTITINSSKADFQLSSDNDWADYGTLYKLYEKAHTPWDWIEQMFIEANLIGLPIFASPFDPSAVEFLETLNCPIYKIASPEITDLGLIECCAKTGKPVVLSTGLASFSDIEAAVATIAKHGNPFMILKCVSAYPTPIEDMNLRSIPWLRDAFKCSVGLSDHTLGPEACYAATALGAALIEKHFRLPGDTASVDAGFSMSIDEVPALKKSITAIQLALGEPTLEVPMVAKPSLSGRRSLYVVRDIAVGELITEASVRSVRPSFGLHPKHLAEVIGRRVRRPLTIGDRLDWDAIGPAESAQ